MAISRLSGQMLNTTLERDGVPLSVVNTANSTPVLYIDVANSKIGVNTATPAVNLDVNGDIHANNLSSTGNITAGNILTPGLLSATGNVYSAYYFVGNVVGNVSVTGNTTDILFNQLGNIGASGNLTFDYANNILTVAGNASVTGNVSANYFIGNGSQLTGVNAASVNANALVGNILSSNVLISSLTQVGTLANISVTNYISAGGNITGANIFSNTISSSGDISAAGAVSGTSFLGSVVSVTGNIIANSVFGNSVTAVTVSTSGNVTGNYIIASGGNTVINASISTTGNVAGNYILGNGSLLTGLAASYSNANVAAYLPVYFGNVGVGNITSNINSNINFAPGANGIVTITDVNGGATGIAMGTPTLGNLVSNAVTLYTYTSVTNGIAELNQVLGKLVPPAPPAFPASQFLSINNSSSYRMANGVTQQDNTKTSAKYVGGGTVVPTVLRSNTYGTSSITTVGPGDSGKLTAYLNSSAAGNVTFNPNATPTANGVYSNLTVFNNFDYHYANANINLGFWYVFSTSALGNVAQGWNEVYIGDNVASNTNTTVWYYDNSNPGTPQFTNTAIATPVSPVYAYSSTIPHYINTNTFTLSANINRLSGNMYPLSDTFVTGSAGGAFGAPVSLTYTTANVTTPLPQNLYANTGNIRISTTATIISGFGASNVGPALSVVNSYATGTNTFNPGTTVLYKTGNTTAIDEGNIVIGSSIGIGSGNAFRIVNPGTGNTPVFTGNESNFNSQTGPLYTYDAIVVGSVTQGLLTFSQTNFTSGYSPVGPNLSGQAASQWFTFKFTRASTSKFNIAIAGTVGGVWVALPGSVFDTNSGGVGPTSDLNGWLNMSLPYGGSGRPGANTANGGNGSNGCSLGGAIPLNTAMNGSYTCTFGTVSSSSTSSNEIYVRIRLTSGQSVTALSLQTASN